MRESVMSLKENNNTTWCSYFKINHMY